MTWTVTAIDRRQRLKEGADAWSCKSPSLVRERIGLQHYPTTNATERLLWSGIGSPLSPALYETIMDILP